MRAFRLRPKRVGFDCGSVVGCVMQRAMGISTATDADADRLIETFVLGFAADPMARWILPDGRDYLDAIKRVFWSFGGARGFGGPNFSQAGGLLGVCYLAAARFSHRRRRH